MTTIDTSQAVAVPRPPARTPFTPGYRGWVLITTPSGRRKVRWVQDGLVFRDDRCREPNSPHRVSLHQLSCQVEPVELVVGGTS